MIYIDIEECNMSVYGKSLNTHNYEGSIHVDNLLYLYEKIWKLYIIDFRILKKASPVSIFVQSRGTARI